MNLKKQLAYRLSISQDHIYIYICTKWYPNLGSESGVDEITRLVVLDKQVKIYLTNRGGAIIGCFSKPII